MSRPAGTRHPGGVRSRPRPTGSTPRSKNPRKKRARRPRRSPMLDAAALVALLVLGALGYQSARADLVGSASGPAWPLTGVTTAAVADRPALAVKIENSVDARPQTGLNAADIVWEQVVEGGITRFVAVYHSTVPSQIGPVRSVRPMDPGIAAPLHGLFAFSGGQEPFVDAVAASGLQVLSQGRGAGGFYRIDSRSAPHNTYAKPQAFLDQADTAHRAGPPAQFVVAGAKDRPTALTAGAPTAAVRLSLSGSAARAAARAACGTSPAGRSFHRRSWGRARCE